MAAIAPGSAIVIYDTGTKVIQDLVLATDASGTVQEITPDPLPANLAYFGGARATVAMMIAALGLTVDPNQPGQAATLANLTL